MVKPKKPIDEADNDKAHLNPDAESQLLFGYANPETGFMIDKVLPPGSGVTYDLFVDAPPEEPEEKVEPELDEDGNPIPVEPKPDPEKLPKHMTIPEVVREGRMHFFKVPKLGSYLAIKLEYQSCLFEEALDEGVKDRLTVMEKEK